MNWFKEPTVDDDSPGFDGETTLQWLSRSTHRNAEAARQFLNQNISALPEALQTPFFRAFHRPDWYSIHFELICARTLQNLGASIELELKNDATGKHPDFVAIFADHTVVVEATRVLANQPAVNEDRSNRDLVRIIEERTPEGCVANIWRLPRIGPNNPKRAFKKVVEELMQYATAEITEPDGLELSHDFPEGELRYTLRPGKPGRSMIGTHGMVSYVDDSESALRKKIRHKRHQLRKASSPVLLAIGADFIGPDLEAFDRALFGLTFERANLAGEIVETGFHSVGEFKADREGPPTIAGVLAFTNVGWGSVNEPVLYMHPRFTGELPSALLDLQQRRLKEGVRISMEPAKRANVMEKLRFQVD